MEPEEVFMLSLSSPDLSDSSHLHLTVLEEFIEITQRKLEETTNPFIRDSLQDLLNSLADQRHRYIADTDTDPVAIG